ncbi:type I toxin-antitoxin system SymE family toxin [Gilliamella sp. B2824]|uniref:SymE family type I addiction module toxin n=1 Tax=Gilliamella sp. B2824 TaxID=2818019 RepID=UPI00226AD79C|nr:SymE family type I addiction module toxin [Gilliamella sp. B2824]MCX8740041.1 type I toxin-antitoxin system SymE family toxin [Gilliamella sp. B2824]
MAKIHSKLKSATGKEPASQPNERFYTVGYVPQGTKPNPRPQLTIKGRWLEQFGFYVGCPVIIKIEQGKLIIEFAIH